MIRQVLEMNGLSMGCSTLELPNIVVSDVFIFKTMTSDVFIKFVTPHCRYLPYLLWYYIITYIASIAL